MATNSHVPPPKRKMIVAPKVGAGRWKATIRLLTVTMVSAVMHVGMLLAFYYVTFIRLNIAQGNDVVEVAQVTQVEDDPHDTDLSNIDIGTDPSIQLNYNVDRIEDVSVPGAVDASQAIGILNAPDALKANVPAPPGSGGGTGAGVPSLDAGVGAMSGAAGGYSSGIVVAGGFGGRSGSTRQKMLHEGGGNLASESAVAKGLMWLALHQAPDGHWSLNEFSRYAHKDPTPASKTFKCTCSGETTRQNDIAATGFGLLPFLAGGFTHKPSKDAKQVDYSKTVKAGLDFLIAKQAANGNFGGDTMYAHGVATIAICEAYGMTSDPMLKTPALKAVRYIEFAQDTAGGGWRYSPKTAGDTSVTGWEVMALKSAQIAGIELYKKEGDKEPQSLKRAKAFLESCKSDNGGYSYLPASGPTPTMTAVGMLCQQYLGLGPRNPGLIKGVAILKAAPPGVDGNNIYYEYYATQAMHHMGGDAWDFWNLGADGKGKGGIREYLMAKQDKILDPMRPLPPKLVHQDGSWAPDGPWGVDGGGRIMYTSLSLLTLEVYYRHLPLYRRDTNVNKEAEMTPDAPK
jgi:hypothetical protein